MEENKIQPKVLGYHDSILKKDKAIKDQFKHTQHSRFRTELQINSVAFTDSE